MAWGSVAFGSEHMSVYDLERIAIPGNGIRYSFERINGIRSVRTKFVNGIRSLAGTNFVRNEFRSQRFPSQERILSQGKLQ